MKTPTKTAVKIAGIALLLGGMAGCGGSDSDGGSDASGASKDASKADFCEKFNGLYTQLLKADPDDTSAAVKGMKDWADEIEDLGTPEEMTDDAREGFEVVISTIKDVDDDADADDLQNLDSKLSDEDNKAADAFSDWTQENCGDPELPGSSPSSS